MPLSTINRLKELGFLYLNSWFGCKMVLVSFREMPSMSSLEKFVRKNRHFFTTLMLVYWSISE